MNMLVFDPIGAMSYRVMTFWVFHSALQDLLNCMKKSEAVLRLVRQKAGENYGTKHEKNYIKFR